MQMFLYFFCHYISMDGKGWHLESRRHSEARLYGRASGSKQLKAPVPKGTLKVYDPKCVSKGNTLYYRLPNGKYVRWGSSWKIGAYKNVMKQFKELDKKDAEKKLSEVKKITPVKETPAQIEADYNAVSKPEYQTHKYDNKKMEYDYVPMKEIIKKNKEANRHFFDDDTKRFFSSRWEATAYKKGDKAYFVTSEQFISPSGEKAPRKYTIRQANLKTGQVETAKDYEFQQFETRQDAQKEIKNILNEEEKVWKYENSPIKQGYVIRELSNGNFRIEGTKKGFLNSDFKTKKEAKRFLKENKKFVEEYTY